MESARPGVSGMGGGGWGYRKALAAIRARSGYATGYISDPFWGDAAAALGLRRTAALLERLGRPQARYGIVHVAGSKGKGSVCAFAAEVLRAAGYRVGRATSPHLHRFPERIAVDGEAATEEVFAALAERAVRATEALERGEPDLGAVTAFELTTAMALDHFAVAGCDLAVVEVGMGGELDATNVVHPLVAVIATLDLEHTATLGTTLPEIARNKAGIIEPGRPTVCAAQPPEALAVVEAVAAERGSRLLVAGRDWRVEDEGAGFALIGLWGRWGGLRSDLWGAHQRENAGLAAAAVWSLAEAGFPVPEAAVRAGLAGTRWPGRFERVRPPGGPDVVLDGAHTPASAAALAAAMAAAYGARRAVLVLGVGADKDPAALARPLAAVAARAVATRARNPRSAEPELVAARLRAASIPADPAPDVAAALARAQTLAGPNGLVLVAGSLYVVAEAREALGLAEPDPPPT